MLKKNDGVLIIESLRSLHSGKAWCLRLKIGDPLSTRSKSGQKIYLKAIEQKLQGHSFGDVTKKSGSFFDRPEFFTRTHEPGCPPSMPLQIGNMPAVLE
jgi:hypothetical protein